MRGHQADRRKAHHSAPLCINAGVIPAAEYAALFSPARSCWDHSGHPRVVAPGAWDLILQGGTTPAPGDVHASRTSSTVRTVLAAGRWPTTERLKRGAGTASAPLSRRSTTRRAAMGRGRSPFSQTTPGATHPSGPPSAPDHT